MVPRQRRSINRAKQDMQGTTASAVVPTSGFLGSTLLRRINHGIIITVPVLLLLLLVVYPLASIILQGIFPHLFAATPDLIPSLDALHAITKNSANYQALFNSIWLAGATAVLACILGTLLAL